jgi:hypothetical protein
LWLGNDRARDHGIGVRQRIGITDQSKYAAGFGFFGSIDGANQRCGRESNRATDRQPRFISS